MIVWVKKAEVHVKHCNKADNKHKSQMLEKCMINLSKALNDQIKIMKCK